MAILTRQTQPRYRHLRPPLNNKADDGGFATVTAIILCAAISILCAGILAVTLTQKRQAERQLFKAQETEAINTAVMEFSTELIRAQGDTTVAAENVVSWPGGHVAVALRGEYEGRKWPLARLDEVDEAILGKYTSLTKEEIRGAFSVADSTRSMPGNDCLRSLFSIYGTTDPKKGFPQGAGLIASAGGHDGQVWRIRANTGRMVEERYVRFTGDSAHLFAIISEEVLVKVRMPNCAAITSVP